ncbi:potassium channel family protein [Natronobacterium texcoconense]|uniref:Trk K+ transport system, NAD-binding component n=1 Tax=Natronobacterium texcoconense TaxID=1095778 RepID=A0A1H1AYJ6_NATTX|nr:NAD-binding protein [Natronobacterium texcoconense]SDQ44611.1 Trk K+ transport system, NAD-binding component [Natronobacterium texcoconense]
MVALPKRLVVYVGSLLFLIGLYSFVYQWGMAAYEGESRTWYQSLEVVVQSMTTTGYGQDAPWETLEMTALVLLIQVTGIAYVLVAIPQFVVPWLETLVEPTPPTEIDGLEDHVIIVGYTALCDTLVDELEASGTPYVILEDDRDRAQELHRDGFDVLYGDPASADALDASQLGDALSVVVDSTERDLVKTVLAIEDRDPDASVFVLVDDISQARYFRYAGVDEVMLPKQRLGKALGDRVRNVVTPDLGDEIELGTDLEIREYHAEPGIELFGEPVAAASRIEEAGVTVLGAWIRGDFVTRLPEQVRIDENTALLVAGTPSELESTTESLASSGRRYRVAGGPVVVAGRGLVGSVTAGSLERAGIETTVIDREQGSAIDVVGDATDEETLREAGIEDAETLVVALERDEDAIRTVLTATELEPSLEVIVGANTAANVPALRAAGADYVLALPNVAGRLITLRTFDYEVMPLGNQLRLSTVSVPALVETEVSTGQIRQETGCAVVGLVRDGELRSGVDGVELTGDDRLVVAGTDQQLSRFRDAYTDE